MIAGFEGAGYGRPVLRRALRADEREALVARVARLRAALVPFGPADRQALGAALAGMMMVYPSMQRAGDEAAAVAAGYLAALAGRPRWAIELVCDRVRTGRVAECREFCPSAPKLAALSDAELIPYRMAIHRLDAVLVATVVLPAPAKSRPRVSRPARSPADAASPAGGHLSRVLADLEARREARSTPDAER
ncbi:hypothetical protein A33M_3341 [Rhodovulum sp. PH10]|nr:hypothetical protein A33M_3341 [Rhodovulum sp. PH10]